MNEPRTAAALTSPRTEGLRWPRTAAGLRWQRTAGVNEPRTAAGLREPRTTAGWFWLGPGLSPDTGRHLPSNSVWWCLGGPREGGGWPRARTVYLGWCHPTPLLRRACRTPWRTRRRGAPDGLGRRNGRRRPCRGSKKGKTKNFSKTRKQKGRRGAAYFL